MMAQVAASYAPRCRPKEAPRDDRSDYWQLRVCALVLSACTFGLFLYMELVPQADVTLLALGTLMVAWIGPLTLLAGTQTGPAFRWWQPFEGGFAFVCMQAFGWALLALFLALCLVMMANFGAIVRFDGMFLLLGIDAFIAQALLNLSLDAFVPAPTLVQRAFLPGWSKALVAALVSVSGTVFFAVYDSGLFAAPWVLLPMGALQFALSALLLHVGVGVKEIQGYRVWMPFEGGSVFLLLQFIGWNCFACMAVSTACLVCRPDDAYGIAACTGLLGLVSQVLVLCSLYCFKASESRQWSWSATHIPEEGFLSGILVVFGTLLTALVCRPSLFPSVTLLVDGNIRLLGSVCLLILASASPVAHCGGYRSVPGYKLWQPFVGDSKFVFLQSMGWLWYGVFFGLSLLILLNDDEFLRTLLPFACALGAAAAAAIALSMPFFPSSAASPATSNIWSGDYRLSLLLAFATIVLHLGVDVLHVSGRTGFVCLALGLLASSLSAMILHGIGCRWYPGAYTFWQPFHGGDAYVLRQALAWTFFSIFALFDCVALGALWTGRAIAPGWLVALSVYALVPHVVLVTSLSTFEPRATEPATSVIWKPLRMSMVASAALNMGSCILFGGAEGFRAAADWAFVGEVLFVIATIVAVIGIACTHCICGPQLYPGAYRLFQPLRGGLRFVVYQGVGWTLAVMAWVAACTVIYWSASFFQISGVVASIGIMFFVAQSVLLGSLFCFTAPDDDEEPVEPIAAVDEALLEPRPFADGRRGAPVSFLGPILGVVSCAAFAVVDMVLLRYGAVLPAFPLTVCAAFALFSSIPLTFRFSTTGRMVYQVLGYALWSFTMLLAAVFTYHVWSATAGATSDTHQWLGVLTGSVGFIAHFILLFSLSPASAHGAPTRVPPVVGCGVAVAVAMWVYEDRLALVDVLVHPRHALSVACCVLVLLGTYGLHRWMLSRTRHVRRRRPSIHQAARTLALPRDVVPVLLEFLTIKDLVQLASTSREHYDSVLGPDVWHGLYHTRLQLHAKRHLQHSVLTAVAPTTLFVDTLCVRVERLLLHWLCDWDFSAHTHATPPRVPPVATASPWKVVVAVVARGGALYRCRVCAACEVLTPTQRVYERDHGCAEHHTSSWVVLCACRDAVTGSRTRAHRQCLERAPTKPPCCSPPAVASRPPTTLVELTRTLEVDVDAAVGWLKLLLLLVAGLHYCGFGWRAPALYVWLLNTTLLSSVLHSTRFDAVVRRIWDDAWAFPLYLRLYYTLSCSSFLVVLWCSPLWSVSSLSAVLQSAFALNMGFYTVLSTLTLFVFAKTALRVPTVGATATPAQPGLPLRARCTLCRLHLCANHVGEA